MENLTNIYQIPVTTIDGQEISLAAYQGKYMLIVNVASRCGFTKQYAGLQALYEKYKNQNLVILGFPCNQFRAQEPGDEAAIKEFCQTKYQVTFPLFAKINVNGKNTHPLYSYLKEQQKGLLNSVAIKWNFTKFLISPTGEVLKRYAPQTLPEEIGLELEKLFV